MLLVLTIPLTVKISKNCEGNNIKLLLLLLLLLLLHSVLPVILLPLTTNTNTNTPLGHYMALSLNNNIIILK